MNLDSLTAMIAGTLGGLGIFLLGMKNLSDGMQAVAGSSLRKLIRAVTDNRLLAVAVGTIVTCIVQSSSITTVMVVGFVNSGIMQLSQAVGVIMGANIGTTITGWILVLDIGKYGLPLLGGAALVHLFAKAERWRYSALVVMGLGMVFFGLEIMKGACSEVKDMPEFAQWFQRFQADTYFGVLRCALVGCILTLVVQSSSATLGMTIVLANQGVISFPTAAALVLGENIGTTITAYLASLGATTNARRAAYFHVVFNVLGVCWVTAIFPWYIELIQSLVDGDVSEVVVANGVNTYPRTTAAIAATHSLFNIANTLVFLPFVPFFVRFLQWLAPDKAFKEKPRLTDLDLLMLETPLLAIEQSRKEILKMGDGCQKMMDWLRTLLQQDEPDAKLIERLQHRERVFDTVQDEVAAFITNLLSGGAPHAVTEEGHRQLRMSDEYESVSDYIADLLNFDLKLRKNNHRFTQKQRADLLQLHDQVAEYLTEVNEANQQQNEHVLTKLETLRQTIRSNIKRLRRVHLEDLSAETIPPQVTVAFMASLNAYSRVRDHSQYIAEAISGER